MCDAAVVSCPRCCCFAMSTLCETCMCAGGLQAPAVVCWLVCAARDMQGRRYWCLQLATDPPGPATHLACDLLTSAVQELEDCCRGSLMNIAMYQHKRECKRALEAVDTCIEVQHALAAQAANVAAAQNPTYTTEALPQTQQPPQSNP